MTEFRYRILPEWPDVYVIKGTGQIDTNDKLFCFMMEVISYDMGNDGQLRAKYNNKEFVVRYLPVTYQRYDMSDKESFTMLGRMNDLELAQMLFDDWKYQLEQKGHEIKLYDEIENDELYAELGIR